jgi:hypothetical protein
MAALTLAELLAVRDRDGWYTWLLNKAAEKGLPVTAWQSGNVLRTLVEIFAEALADESQSQLAITKGGFLGDSSGDWLTLFAESQFSNPRTAATFALVRVRLTSTAGSPYTITPGSQRFEKSGSNPALRYSSANTTNQVLPAGGTLDLDYRADSPGAAYNLVLGATIVSLTPLAGVTIALIDAGAGTPMVSAGVDDESDELLTTRCATKWASLAYADPADAYVQWALSADATITRVYVNDTNAAGAGTVAVYLAGASGGAGAGAVAAANTLIQARRPLTATVTVAAATNVAVTITATVKVKAAYLAAAQAKLPTLLAELNAVLEIGDGLGKGTAYRSAVVEMLMTPDGVVDASIATVLLNGAAADVSPGLGFVVVLALGTITWQSV